jgi:aryl-alcohol dehydrogenase-like predicted oxidoreductase
MKTRRIGSLDVSIVGLGANNFGRWIGDDESVAVLESALENGITFIDTADTYGQGRSEEILGRALMGRRDEVVLATKFGHAVQGHAGGASPEYLRGALTRSLRRLRTDWIDLYILHRPVAETPIAETLGALEDLRSEGLLREIGCSTFRIDQLKEALATTKEGGTGFVNLQNEFNLLNRQDERELLPFCASNDISYVPFFPLASGLLTGKYRSGEAPGKETRMAKWEERGPYFLREENFVRVEALRTFAECRQLPLAKLAIAWILTRPAVASVIAGATRPEQIEVNVGAASVELTSGELAEVDLIAPIALNVRERTLVDPE